MMSRPPRVVIQQNMARISSFYHASATTSPANHGTFSTPTGVLTSLRRLFAGNRINERYRDVTPTAGRTLRAGPSVTFYRSDHRNILGVRMTQLSPSDAHSRPPRLNLVHSTTAILRVPSGLQVHGKLQVISVSGGLLSLSSPLNRGTPVKLMFRAETGPVSGAAEMLIPLSRTLQPFRFVKIGEDDRRRLNAAIQSSVDRARIEQQSIVRDRAW
jgi:hypothetical protein